MPAIVAKYLVLQISSSFTRHCFRRSLATVLVNSGVNIMEETGITVAESYIEEHESFKFAVARKIWEKVPVVSLPHQLTMQLNSLYCVIKANNNNYHSQNLF